MKKLQIDKKEIAFLKKDTDLIENNTIQNWALNYLNGHIDHYNGILLQVIKALKLGVGERVLEVGGVPGQLTTYLSKEGFDIDMIDIDPFRINGILEKHSIKAYKVDVERENLPIDNEVYDLVLFNEVFEHLHINPLRIIIEINRVLKSNGILLMSVPNINPLMRWEFLFGKDYNDNLKKEFAKIENIGHMGHFRLYSKSEIISILEDFDFEVIESTFQGKIYDKKSKWLKLFKFLFGNKMKNQLHVIARKK
ncbi:bifunctional 2-polyprenyl-6-hydroxyphenol methylase/3-demethylubiquinol 3-O-methyltransferase UbiG [Aequorivita sp. CIP111184]|uniref:class I SAM-dependent methyltransferase n=1 Tax=Aequorivita sp. CIP111184 TaxID=2211356 RepID=UPI0015EB509B|nr:class I SAM-dependent methyltransferase [Aequorivita sp. CIP111184]